MNYIPGLGKDLTDSSDDDSNKIPILSKFNTTDSIGNKDTGSHKTVQRRPSTAPASFKLKSEGDCKSSALPWSVVNAPPTDIKIAEVSHIALLKSISCL